MSQIALDKLLDEAPMPTEELIVIVPRGLNGLLKEQATDRQETFNEYVSSLLVRGSLKG